MSNIFGVIQLILFLHVAAALGLAAAFSIEGLGLWGLRRSATREEARLWIATRRWLLRLGPASIGLVLLTGIYLSAVDWGAAGWIVVSIVILLLLALAGALLTGIPMARAEAALGEGTGALSESVLERLRAPVLTVSLLTRISLTLAVLLLMVAKPSTLVAAAAATGFGIAGMVAGWALGARR